MKSREGRLRHEREFIALFRRELESENVEIFLLVVEVRGLRNRGNAELEAPAKRNLRRRDAVGGGNFLERRVTQERAAAERAPGLNKDAVIHAEAQRRALENLHQLQKLALGEDGRVLTENITYQTKDGAVYVTSRCVCLENIAQEAPLTLPEEPENPENIGVFVGNVQGNG